MSKIWGFIKNLLKKKTFLVIVLIIVLGGGYLAIKTIVGSKVEYITEEVKRSNIKQTVSATGTVTTADKIDLSFKASGTISEILVKEGDEVKIGDVLAKLDDRAARAQLRQAEANLASAISNLNKILAGASPEDVKISQESVNNAKISYENAKRDYDALVLKLEEDIAMYQKAVSSAEISLADSQKNLENAKTYYSQNVINSQNNAITSMETNLLLGEIVLNNINYNLSLLRSGIAFNQQNVSNCENYRLLAASEIEAAKKTLAAAKAANDINEIYAALNQSISALNKVLTSLSALSEAVGTAAASNAGQLTTIETIKTNIKADQSSISGALSSVQAAQQSLVNAQNNYQTQIDTYQAAVNTANNNLLTARTNLSAALANKNVQLSNAKAAVDNALGAYNLAKAQYEYKIASPRSVDISYYRSQVTQAKASVEFYKNQLDDYTLKAPTDGKIAFVNYSIGEQTSLSKPVISLLGKNKFYIEVDIPESDIAKVKVGNRVEITLDAYSDEVKFQGKVILIYPAETVIQDVVYYKVKVEIGDSNYEIKSGMTANCDILTAEKQNVLVMPYRALQEKDGRKFVRLLVGNKVIEKDIVVGLRGDEGEIEIISGPKEGDKIIIFERNRK